MKNQYFETRFVQDERRKASWVYLCKFFQKYVDQNGTVLELGAGYCYFINQIDAKEKIAVDLFPDLLSHAEFPVKAFVRDATKLDFIASNSVDVIFASNFLEHLDWNNLDNLITEIDRILGAKGKILIMQPNFRLSYRNYFDDYTHRTVFTDTSLIDWFGANGFKAKHSFPKFLPLSVKSSMGKFSRLIPFYISSPWKPKAGQMFFVFERI